MSKKQFSKVSIIILIILAIGSIGISIGIGIGIAKDQSRSQLKAVGASAVALNKLDNRLPSLASKDLSAKQLNKTAKLLLAKELKSLDKNLSNKDLYKDASARELNEKQSLTSVLKSQRKDLSAKDLNKNQKTLDLVAHLQLRKSELESQRTLKDAV